MRLHSEYVPLDQVSFQLVILDILECRVEKRLIPLRWEQRLQDSGAYLVPPERQVGNLEGGHLECHC